MTWTTYYATEDLILNLSEPDLGHADRPDLWEFLRAQELPRGTILCLGCTHLGGGGGCKHNHDGAMFLRTSGGRRQAAHYPAEVNRVPRTAEETDTHKALKEYIAESAERAGFRAATEATSARSRRRADVTIAGANGLQLRVEAQVSTIHPATVAKRDRMDRHDGATPLWVTRQINAIGGPAAPPWIDRSPWILIRNASWQDITGRVDLDVRGGVKHLVFEQCGRRSPLCPAGGGAPCGREHAYFDPKHAVILGDLVGEMAAGEMVDLRVPRSGGRTNFHIVPAHDAKEWTAFQGAIVAGQGESPTEEFNQLEPNYECDVRPWDRRPAAHSRTDYAKPVFTGITRDVAPPARDPQCLSPGCDVAGQAPQCMLCPASPTYWRKNRSTAPEGLT